MNSQHSTVDDTTQKEEEFPFAQLPVLPSSSHGESFKNSAKDMLKLNCWLCHTVTFLA